MVYNFFDKKTSGGAVNSKIMLKQQKAEELHKPVIRKFENRKVYSFFMDNVQGANPAEMQLISKFNKVFRFLLYVIDIYNKHAWNFL